MAFQKPGPSTAFSAEISPSLLNSLKEKIRLATDTFSTATGEKIPSATDAGSELARAAQSGVLRGKALAAFIDHTLLKPEAREADFERICREAREHEFATVCVNGSAIPLVARLLEGSEVKPIAVVGFPLGASTMLAKAYETHEAVKAGAREIDMVLAVGRLKDQDYGYVFQDIRHVVEAARPAPVKVILETSLLTREEKIIACAIAREAGAAFVKTSTGFSSAGATVEDVTLMRAVVGPEMGVKASGGIRSLKDALAMIGAGANRIGASASVAIVTETSATGGGGY